MATGAALTPKRIAPSALDRVLEQARVEGWRAGIFGPRELRPDGVPEAHTFYLREPLGTRISKLATLTQLTSLDLSGIRSGARGRALAALPQLSSLALSVNQIGGYDHLVKTQREEGRDHTFFPEDADRK